MREVLLATRFPSNLPCWVLPSLAISWVTWTSAFGSVSSVANPAVSVLLGILLFQERLTRPAWHIVVAFAALLAALAGATLITLANRETRLPDTATGPEGGRTDRTFA
jgi:hypothetical protein